jgi:hypothetical protein
MVEDRIKQAMKVIGRRDKVREMRDKLRSNCGFDHRSDMKAVVPKEGKWNVAWIGKVITRVQRGNSVLMPSPLCSSSQYSLTEPWWASSSVITLH